MITEEQANGALPPRGWLRDYVTHGVNITDAPLAYHIAAGIAVLSQTMPIGFIVPDGHVRVNIYAMLVGTSTEPRKTTVVNTAERVLKLGKRDALMPNPGSVEAFIDSLIDCPQQLLPIGEGAPFLSEMQRGYLRPLKDRLCEAYDCQRLSRITVRGKKITQEDPRFSMLMGIADSFLESSTDDADWTGGFLGRFFTIYAARERFRKHAGSDDVTEAALGDRLRELAELGVSTRDAITPGVVGKCLGFDAEAEDLWGAWVTRVNAAVNERAARTVQPAVGRAPTMAIKIAAILAWDLGDARLGTDWHITAEILRYALAITDLHVESVIEIGASIFADRDMRIMHKVLKQIGLDPTPISRIFAKAQVTAFVGESMLKTLLIHRRIECADAVDGERCFRRVNGIPRNGAAPSLVLLRGGGDFFADPEPGVATTMTIPGDFFG